MLGKNQIEVIDHLSNLKKLDLLDLSYNKIRKIGNRFVFKM
jgi:Leucine-rich repeat (LRR) protein